MDDLCVPKTGLPKNKIAACDSQEWKSNLKLRYNYRGYTFNFMDCLEIQNDGFFNFVQLPDGLNLYHGSSRIGKLIRNNGIDPIWPIGIDSKLEETWYSSYPIADSYGEGDLLVYSVKNSPKMFILNDSHNLDQLLQTAYTAFPKSLTADQKALKDYYILFLHYALWIQTGKGGKLLRYDKYKVSAFVPDSEDISYEVGLDRHGSRWLEQEFAKFFCGWLGDKYGYAGYISDEAYTTDPRLLVGKSKNCFFHPEVMFCYAPNYLDRKMDDPLDTASSRPDLMIVEPAIPLITSADYLNYYLSIKNDPRTNSMTKQKWLARVMSLYMPRIDINADKFTHICDVEGGRDTYELAVSLNKYFRDADPKFPSVWQINQITWTTNNVIGFMNDLCKRMKKLEPYLQLPMEVDLSGA